MKTIEDIQKEIKKKHDDILLLGNSIPIQKVDNGIKKSIKKKNTTTVLDFFWNIPSVRCRGCGMKFPLDYDKDYCSNFMHCNNTEKGVLEKRPKALYSWANIYKKGSTLFFGFTLLTLVTTPPLKASLFNENITYIELFTEYKLVFSVLLFLGIIGITLLYVYFKLIYTHKESVSYIFSNKKPHPLYFSSQ